ncbi:MAG: hypothetical protein IPM29_08200 [Planctomycetes bacterium]|nr:hypothetical protein [Planctomycetota bacterium]
MNSEERSSAAGTGPRARASAWGILVGPAFLGLAAWLHLGNPPAEIPRQEPMRVDTRRLTTEPRRKPSELHDGRPLIFVNSFLRHCSECHNFPLSEVQIRNRQQHGHIVLEHGINDACHNCHDLSNMDQLILRGGRSIPYADVPELCRTCHGPTFQDWQRGIHGRVNGYWDATRGEQHHLRCVECHDPHRPRHPAMDPLVPLPGPNTLRMGDPRWRAGESHEGPEEDPLRRVTVQSREEDR